MTEGNVRIGITGRTHWNTGGQAERYGLKADPTLLGADDAPPGYTKPPATAALDINETYREMVPMTYRVLKYFVHGCLALSCACMTIAP